MLSKPLTALTCTYSSFQMHVKAEKYHRCVTFFLQMANLSFRSIVIKNSMNNYKLEQCFEFADRKRIQKTNKLRFQRINIYIFATDNILQRRMLQKYV